MSAFFRQLVAVSIVVCLFALASPVSVLAKDILTGGSGGVACSGDNQNSAVCNSQTTFDPATGKANDPISGSNGLLAKITDIVSYIAGAAAVIVILISALRYITSGSDVSTSSRTDTDVEAAKKTIAGAVIGLVVIVLAHTLIVFLINKL